jgi:hypothetical protein
MKRHDDSEICLPQVERVEDFCFGASFHGLLDHDGEAVATVDEGRFEGETYRRRGPDLLHALGPRDLFLILAVPVGVLLPARHTSSMATSAMV